jgi:two-component system sensor histidine kinase CpxA
MRISRLYIRNFIMVMSIVLVAQIFIAGLFRLVGSRAGERNFRSQISCIAFLLQDRIASRTTDDYTPFLRDLSMAWRADIWLESSDGTFIASGTWERRPPFPENMSRSEQYGMSIERSGPRMSHMTVKSPDGTRILYIKKNSSEFMFSDLHFIIGLVIITVMTALVLLPVSRRITGPLKKLTESAEAISRGEFNLRVEETSGDEVGELARAFNRMSDRVLQMINGTKQLTANISHQIRSPLTRISVTVELAREKIAAGKRKDAEKMMASIEQEIADIVKLTERIIELIHMDVAHGTGDYVHFGITEIVSETAIKFADVMAQKSIRYASEFSRVPVIMKGLPGDIRELFDILYDNAVRYSPEGGSMNCVVRDEEGAITVELSNKSGKFSDDMLANIFRPFQRFAPESIPGNGLGLAIAKRIVENHGGVIGASSSDGLFTVRIVFGKGA